MLSELFEAKLPSLLVPQELYRPYPTADEREEWESLPQELRSCLIERGEKYLGYEWPNLPAVRFMDFVRDGNRSRFEALHFARRTALATLVLAECAEGKGRFLDDIINGIWCICEESFWGVPAHNITSKRERIPLPDVTDPIIDLFAGETAGLLAWTHYLLRSQLDAVTELVTARIRLEMKKRILDPYLKGNFWWMGFDPGSHHVNNWNPWCNSNCLTAFLLLEEDAARRQVAVRKALQSLDRFLAVYHPDGGCDEGPGYWNRAGGSLFDCLELLYGASNGQINVYDEPLIQEIGRYIYRVHISEDYFINFADADTRVQIASDLVYRYGRRINDHKLMGFGAWMFQRQEKLGLKPKRLDSILRQLPMVFNYREITTAPAQAPLERDVWLDGIQVMAAREQSGATEGLYLAAKGGHNNESHNHNDVGQFIVFCDGTPMLIDVGVETYTAKTFSERRYEIWTMQSAYHNLPTVNGYQQLPGENARASNVSYQASDHQVQFSLDIAPCYPPEAGISSWRRTCIVYRGEGCGKIEIADDFSLEKATKDLFLSLMTPWEPELQEAGCIILQSPQGPGIKVRFASDRLEFSSEKIPISDARMTPIWGDRVFRILLQAKDALQSDTWKLQIERI